MSEVDGEKDHYHVLGLKFGATNEELKAAYVALARKHHPDTAKQNDKTATAEFIKLSEAWSVLSKPETKSKYDILRREYLMRTVGRTVNLPDREISSAQREIHQGFNIQKDHYSSVVSARASSNWQDIQDKYRTTKWQSMSLKDRKAHRAKPMAHAGRLGGIYGPLIGIAAVGCLVFMYSP